MKKAYEVTANDLPYSALIFAENTNKAKLRGMSCDGFEDLEYIDIRVIRRQQVDKYASVSYRDELCAWIEEHQKILVDVLGWEEVE
jgi:hypothetical protein